MKQLKFSGVLTVWVQFIGTITLSSLLISTTISVQPAFSKDKINTLVQDIELGSESTVPTPSLGDQPVATEDVNQRVISVDKRASVSQPKQPELIAQVDPSSVVGDSLGEINQLREKLLIEPIIKRSQKIQAAPSSSAGTPTGYGANWRQAYIGGGGYIPLDDGSSDGSLALGFGLGDSAKSVGLEVALNINSIGGQGNNDFGESGTVGLKLHKLFQDGTAIAVGWGNPVKWGEADQFDETIYGVVTKSFPLNPSNSDNQLPLTVSVGVGTGSFSSQDARRAGDNTPNVFGSLGLKVSPQASLISSWTGNSLNVGASFVPSQDIPLVINGIFTDITDSLEFSDGSAGFGFSLTAGYVFQF
ncbi:hypothetical protein VB711_16220 [Cronbergia sp. UHCC 0137]|uniref:hypothetical protein n=1 Tax=Cronbergia sp. UHCC 0137 TaxID=3110239 RepID=UPI002B1FE3BA|nr:hypothetical protein [Cronbergia sp. UHCC 0137]MEA5619375.1 hypothetical protein [Cronbergia sp. UHCC 0137]